MLEHFEYEDGTVAAARGLTVRVAFNDQDPDDQAAILISGFPDERAVIHFLMWADFDQQTFEAECPFPWSSELSWDWQG